MDGTLLWRQTLQHYREQGLAIVSLNELSDESDLRTFAENAVPLPVSIFFQHCLQAPDALWLALVQSTMAVWPSSDLDYARILPTLEPVRALLARAEQMAFVHEPAANNENHRRWSYLFQITASQVNEEPAYLMLYLSATPEEIAEAQNVLRLRLPPGYRHLLMLTNGLRTSPSGTQGIYSVGSTYARWNAVLFNHWLECEKYPHEIAANWRVFQGIYDYERIRDWENSRETFASDETILVPFAFTYETWCFDRTRRDKNGEYPIVLWDHETREARDYYVDFTTWLSQEVEAYFFA